MKKLGVPESLANCTVVPRGNGAMVRVGEELLEEIEVRNGLRQGCTMAPTLFNLYSCVIVEAWLERTKNVEGAGACPLQAGSAVISRSTSEIEHVTEFQYLESIIAENGQINVEVD